VRRKDMQTVLSFCRLTLLGMGLQQPISKWIQNGYGLKWLKTHCIPIDIWVIFWLVSSVNE
jgi:hypothetical protein